MKPKTKSTHMVLPATDHLDNPKWRGRTNPPVLSFVLPDPAAESWTPEKSLHHNKARRIEFLSQKPSPFELSMLASNMTGADAAERVKHALGIWDASLEALVPKEPPRATIRDLLLAVWPKKTRTERMDWMRGFLFEEIGRERANDPQRLRWANSTRKTLRVNIEDVEERLQSFEAHGVPYPQELATRMFEWGNAESDRRKAEACAKGGKAKSRGKAGESSAKKKNQKSKKALGDTKPPASSDSPPPSSDSPPLSKNWVSRKQRPTMR